MTIAVLVAVATIIAALVGVLWWDWKHPLETTGWFVDDETARFFELENEGEV